MTKEKEEKSELEKCILRKRVVWVLAFVAIVIGGMLAIYAMGTAQTFFELRSDDYMNDPSIPFNERDNATYTFTDEWLSERYNYLMWVAMPGLVLYLVGVGVLFLGDGVMSYQSVHKAYCRQWQNEKFAGNDGLEDMKYCPECGLKLSQLEKK